MKSFINVSVRGLTVQFIEVDIKNLKSMLKKFKVKILFWNPGIYRNYCIPLFDLGALVEIV